MTPANSALDSDQPASLEPSHRLASLATQHTVRRQQKVWSRRVGSWDQHASTNLTNVTAAVIEAARIRPGAQVIDLGCGNGQIGMPLARQGAEVLAVDVSPAMVAWLTTAARRDGVRTLAAVAVAIEELALPAGCADLIVSSYVLHHLRDGDKARLVQNAFGWLRPGGRIVIADMMFGRGGSARDREIIGQKVAALARKGLGGWWRIAKNAARYMLRVQERPVSMDSWATMLRQAGFADVTAVPIVAEAGLVTGLRPASPGGQAQAAVPAREA
jgi:2-polyprenyl-3-methyl-5-hydroxy-6-metoxy-1,4-benzoquinol methylase